MESALNNDYMDTCVIGKLALMDKCITITGIMTMFSFSFPRTYTCHQQCWMCSCGLLWPVGYKQASHRAVWTADQRVTAQLGCWALASAFCYETAYCTLGLHLQGSSRVESSGCRISQQTSLSCSPSAAFVGGAEDEEVWIGLGNGLPQRRANSYLTSLTLGMPKLRFHNKPSEPS